MVSWFLLVWFSSFSLFAHLGELIQILCRNFSFPGRDIHRFLKSDAERAIIRWGLTFITSKFQLLCIFHLLKNQWETWRSILTKDHFCPVCYRVWIYFKMMPFICHTRWEDLFLLMEEELKSTNNEKTNFYLEKFRIVFLFEPWLVALYECLNR